MRLIDADEAYTDLYHELEMEIIPEEDDEYYPLHFGRREGIGKAMDLIKDLPTIDAVEVIRCKDCIYSWEGAEGEYFCHWDEDNQTRTEADGYCHRAKRREEQ